MNNNCETLIIDDEFVIRKGLKDTINWEKEGFKVIGKAYDEKEAIDMIKRIQLNLQTFSNLSINNVHLDNMLTKLLLGFNIDIDFDEFNDNFDYNDFIIFGIEAGKIFKNYEERTYFIKTFISELNMFLSSSINAAFNTLCLNNETVLYLINFNINNISYLTYKLKNFSKTFAQKYPDCFLVLSMPFNNLSQLKDVYNKNFLLLSSQYFYNKGCTFFSYSDYTLPGNMHNFNFKLFKELISYMKIDDAFNLLSDYISKSSANKFPSEMELKNIVQICTYIALSNFEDLEINYLKKQFFDKIYKAVYSDDLIVICNQISTYFLSLKNNFNSHMIKKIIKYIENNYSKPLTLSEVAKKFNFNYSYLSSYFSSHNSEGFNEFLNKIRIKKSCELLQKDIPISSISSIVGYSDQSYYSKVFKKFTGCTPSKYKKSIIKS